MDTKALEKFCPWARVRLIEAVDLRCHLYGLDDAGRASAPAGSDVVAGRVLTAAEKSQRDALLARVDATDGGYDAFVQEAAYTWFNRYIAIRYMELHGYLASNVRMLSCAADGSFAPDCLRQAADLPLPGLDQAEVLRLMGEGDDEAVFRLVLVAQCNELAAALPDVFGHVGEADALLLPGNLLRQGADDVLYHLVADIPQSTWENVEVLGWMYQFYNAELKADFFNSKRKAAAADIAPATQLFTPEWIVRYMVENSLGRLWMLNHPQSALRERMAYYIEPDAEHEDFLRVASPEDITFCDPACGSGHILSYAFELLFAMYEESGYREREIPELILTKNLAGMEIDERAAQIASLVLALRAREHDRRFFRRDVHANVCVLESIPFEEGELAYASKALTEALSHLGEVGSLLAPGEKDLADLRADLASCAGDLFANAKAQKLKLAIERCEALSRRFDVVVANPPYMGSAKFNPFMSGWVKKHYPDVKSDLCTCFIERNLTLIKDNGITSLVTSDTCMYLSSFAAMREKLVKQDTILAFADTRGSNAHPDVFDANAIWVLQRGANPGYMGAYVKLNQRIGEKGAALVEAIQNPACGWFYRRDAQTFTQIPGTPIAYWASNSLLNAFGSAKQLSEYGKPRQGLATGENARFVREWWEVTQTASCYDCSSIAQSVESGCKWFPYNKGGDFRKWYGNNECVVDWQNDGAAIKEFSGSVIRNPDCYFKPSITWSKISSGSIAFRYKPYGHVFDVAGTSIFADDETLKYLQGACNSSTIMLVASMLSPTLNFEVGQIATYPIIESDELRPSAVERVERARNLSKSDWDSFETSWDFKRHPLL